MSESRASGRSGPTARPDSYVKRAVGRSGRWRDRVGCTLAPAKTEEKKQNTSFPWRPADYLSSGSDARAVVAWASAVVLSRYAWIGQSSRCVALLVRPKGGARYSKHELTAVSLKSRRLAASARSCSDPSST